MTREDSRHVYTDVSRIAIIGAPIDIARITRCHQVLAIRSGHPEPYDLVTSSPPVLALPRRYGSTTLSRNHGRLKCM